MLPPAPALFSITIGWPSEGDMPSPINRATRSALPPAANGQMKRTGLSGYAAKASRGTSVVKGAAASVASRVRREIGMAFLEMMGPVQPDILAANYSAAACADKRKHPIWAGP